MPLHDKVFHYGERGSFTKTKSGRPQVYEKILRKCLQENKLFEDPEFPCQDSSINIPDMKDEIFWQRPKEIVKKPRFFVGGSSRHDIRQTNIGNCWFVAALAGMTEHKELFDRVVPKDQSFKEGLYAGAFHFLFWNDNRWVDIVIDDRLPMFQSGGFMSVKSVDDNEFWSSLLEKAYAKLNGSYGALVAGRGWEVMPNLTGGIPELIPAFPLPDDIWNTMKFAFDRKSIITVDSKYGEGSDKHLDVGLTAHHEYTVSGMAQLEASGETVKLIRLRNPWGHVEYNGPWSDKSDKWDQVPQSKREELGVVVRDDGEFWLDDGYFRETFDAVNLCYLQPDSIKQYTYVNCWQTSAFEGSWLKGVSAGGPDLDDDKYGINPQYLLTIPEPQHGDDDKLLAVLVSMRIKGKRPGKYLLGPGGRAWNPFGFAMYKVHDPRTCPKPIPVEYLRRRDSFITREDIDNQRNLTIRLHLRSGTYCVVPFNVWPDTENDFLLRIFTEQKSECREWDREVQVLEPLKAEDIEDVKGEEVLTDGGRMGPEDLREKLKKTFQEGGVEVDFPLDVCYTMVAFMDKDMTGEMYNDDFKTLHEFLQKCQDAHKMYDDSSTGSISTLKLREALEHAGCYVNQRVLRALVKRYSRENKIDFVNFVACAVKVACLEAIHKQYAKEDGNATFSLNEWMEATISC